MFADPKHVYAITSGDDKNEEICVTTAKTCVEYKIRRMKMIVRAEL